MELKWRSDEVPRKRSQKHARLDKDKERPDESTLPSGQLEPLSGPFTQKKFWKREEK
jgi:hypothetical protein